MTAREKYKDIIDMPHHVSETHPQMSMQARAGQFAPFAALTGYDESVAKQSVISAEENDKSVYFEEEYWDENLRI